MDPEGCMADLFQTLDLMGIHPGAQHLSSAAITEQRVAKVAAVRPISQESRPVAAEQGGIQVGDRVIIRYLDDNKSVSFILTADRHDPTNGYVSVSNPLGAILLGCNEEDEVEIETSGAVRRALVVRVERIKNAA
jgi:transcription elongation GreA/GreB family factor